MPSTRPPNGVRLSCGAELNGSQTKDYLKKRGAGSFRRVLGAVRSLSFFTFSLLVVEFERLNDATRGRHNSSDYLRRVIQAVEPDSGESRAKSRIGGRSSLDSIDEGCVVVFD